ncbi:hypothetical protein FC38_GL000757 [Lactobacillus gigeriorum DSM 23908 = CRBIP 24.85]|uniref:Uncharacterized protein n=2 Tax=Lactobacillus gigeriorum DSM 23908 = CRBIP 24.85 TaxID=1423751 RepID=A0ABR5PUS3_9LACO|nr:hypothetical protein FC38_GL000757 [Lactobacillus gigeriorum DSM 23908 = CRBIP 24.85]
MHHCWIILTIDLFLQLKSKIIEVVHLNLATVIGIYLFVGITCGLLLYFSSRIKNKSRDFASNVYDKLCGGIKMIRDRLYVLCTAMVTIVLSSLAILGKGTDLILTPMGIINLILLVIAAIGLIASTFSRKLVESLSKKYRVSNICWIVLGATILASLAYGDARNWIWIVYVLFLFIYVLTLYIRGDFVNGRDIS